MTIEMDYGWINGPECDPDWYCTLAGPQRLQRSANRKRPSNRRKVGKRARTPVVAIEPEPNRPVLTVPEAAWVLHCSPNTVWNLITTRQLKSFKLGRRRLVARGAVEAFVSESEGDS